MLFLKNKKSWEWKKHDKEDKTQSTNNVDTEEVDIESDEVEVIDDGVHVENDGS